MKRRLAWVMAVVVSLSVALGVMAAPAQAARICSGAPAINLCLWIDRLDSGFYRVHVGIDVHMSLDVAQEYVDDAGNPFAVVTIGNSGSARFVVPLVAVGASAESGLSGDFETVVSGSALNENPAGQDRIRARVQLIDTDTNRITGTYTSGVIVGNWP
ncbi:hypothetical protein [Actinoplanes sichuanensis]|uniref:Uncharacterized protein n=1 Tax=Actinoplanes sichuanensis TaxID=512349 RepID=A0ABW4A395_9ACTN|nr:hypothetical protein [Actinoplanes sichuanensis]